MRSILSLIDRKRQMFISDLAGYHEQLSEKIENASFLVLGGAGTIGQAVTNEIFKRRPKRLHVVDISENNLVELVRDVRSTHGYIEGDFQTFSLDIGSVEFDAFVRSHGEYDYVLNLSALKHVRSEKDPFTLMRMIDVNIFNTDKTIQLATAFGAKKYFCVSTDKATNPVNLMGASKRIMEMYLTHHSNTIEISTARFANVAFSDGSLLHSFHQRLQKKQPIVAPYDIERYFVTPQESGVLCLMSCIFGANRDIFFPKLSQELHLLSFAVIARKFLSSYGYEVYECRDENEARELISSLPSKGLWPCLFTKSDTTGEKSFEEFYTNQEVLDLDRFNEIGIIKGPASVDYSLLSEFEQKIKRMKKSEIWKKDDITKIITNTLPELNHLDVGKYLDSKM